MPRKQEEKKEPNVLKSLFVAIDIPLTIFLADVWLGFYFFDVIQGTWMECPLIITCIAIGFFDVFLFGVLTNAFE